MAEDVDFSAELEQYLDQHDYDMPRPGDIRKGLILDITDRGVIIGLGLKRDGFVPPDDLAKLSEEERAALEVDSEIPVYIVDTGQHDSLNVSIHRAMINEDWIKAEEMMKTEDVVEAEVVGYNRGGALVDYGRLRGFIPLSQLAAFRPGMKDRDKQRMLSKLRGEQLPLKIIEVDRRRRRLVMSNREAQKEWDDSRRTERFAEMNSGDTLKGEVSSIRDFGAFVDIGDGIEGLIHVSELAWHRIDHPSEVINVGDEIEVYVLKIDNENSRISLSRKRLLDDPWTLVENNYTVNELVEGVVTRIVNYGAFIEIEPGIEGLLHASKMVRGSDAADPGKIVQVGEKHLLRVINIDSERQRIALSLRAVTPKEQIAWMMSQGTEDDSEDEESAVVEGAEAAPDDIQVVEAEAVVEEVASADVTEEAEASPAAEETDAPAEAAVETETATEVVEEAAEEAEAPVAEETEAPAEAAVETETATEVVEEAAEEAEAPAAEETETPAEETEESAEEEASADAE
ncbi:MAG: 30S ribosomal protein S1 [Anaerolineae bacterium]